MNAVMVILFIIFFVLGLVIYHSIFDIWYFDFSKAIIRELLIGAFFAILMTVLTLKFWFITAIIIVILGLVFRNKISNPAIKKIVFIIFIVVAVLISITGIRLNVEEKQQKDAEERHKYFYANCLPENRSWEIDEFVKPGKTYVMKRGNSVFYMNALFDTPKEVADSGKYTYLLSFLKIENGMRANQVVDERFTSGKKDILKMVCDSDNSCYFVLNGHNESIDITLPSDKKEYSGTYKITTDADYKQYQNKSMYPDKDEEINNDYGEENYDKKTKEDNESIDKDEEESYDYDLSWSHDQLLGKWNDSVSKRCMMDITHGENRGEYRIDINWPISRYENTHWVMTCKWDNDTNSLHYSSGHRYYETVTDGTVIEENNLEGVIGSDDNIHLIWIDSKDRRGRNCLFEKSSAATNQSADSDFLLPDEYSRAAEPPVRCGESHMSGLTGATLL